MNVIQIKLNNKMPIMKTVILSKMDVNMEYVIGKDAQDNFDIIDDAEIYHWWFHIDGQSSGHVIAKTDEDINKKILRYVIKQGAVLCKQYSRCASMKNVKIVYARIRDVEKTDKIGMVIVKNAKFIEI